MSRQRVYSGGPWEIRVGYCRATRIGDFVYVSGSTAMKDGELVGVNDAAAQARQTLETIGAALEECGSGFADVVRYRVYLTQIEDSEAVGLELSRVFAGVHPAGTVVAVSALIDPRMRVEIEVDAIAGSASPL